MMHSNKFLITAIGGDIAQSICRALKEFNSNIEIIGTDINSQNAGQHFCKKFYEIPRADHKDYLTELKNIINKEKIDTVIPVSEAEIRQIYNLPSDYLKKIICVSKIIFDICSDKFLTFKFLEKNNLGAPWTVSSLESIPKNYPAIYKPRNLSGSRSVMIVETEEDAEWLKAKNQDYIFQERLLPSDEEVTCGVYRSFSGDTFIIQILRKLVGGRTSWGQVINNSEITKLCTEIAQKLDLFGSINVQLINTKDGPKVFEINPRFSSTVFMRHKLGFTDLIWQINEQLGNEVQPQSITKESKIARIDDVIIF